MKQSTSGSLERQLQNNVKAFGGFLLNVSTNTVFLCSVPSDIAYFVKGEEDWQAPNYYLWSVFGVSVFICALDGFVHKIMYSSARYNHEYKDQGGTNVQDNAGKIKYEVEFSRSVSVNDEGITEDRQPCKPEASVKKDLASTQPLLHQEHKHHGCWSRFRVPFLANMCRLSESLGMTSLPASFIALLSYSKVIPKITPVVRVVNLTSTGIAAFMGYWSSKADYAMAVKHLEEHYTGHSDGHDSEHSHNHSCGLRGGHSHY